MNARSIQIGTIIDAVAWARNTLFVVLATPSGSPQRRAKLDELARATVRARELANAYDGSLAMELRMTLGIIELALARFRIPSSGDDGSPGQADRGSRSAGTSSSVRRRPRIHPRRLVRTTS